MTTLNTLITQARAAGADDAYSFAEWLCDERQYFGQLEEGSDLESAWQQAMEWWNTASSQAVR